MSNQPTTPLASPLPRRRVGRSIFLSAIIFISGAAVGWALSVYLVRPRGLPPGLQPDPPVDQLVRHMTEELLLTDEQSRQITQIYQARFAALKSIRQEMRPRFNKEYEELRTEVQKVLTPPQFAQWDRRFESTRNRMLPPPPPGQRPEDRDQQHGPPDRPGPPDRDGRQPPPPPDSFGPGPPPDGR